MANPDRPNGFTPVKKLDGSPWNGVLRQIGVTDGADLFVGDVLSVTSGLAARGAVADTTFLGIAMGFGKVLNNGSVENNINMFNPQDLEQRFYDDSESTHTDWVVFYCPLNDMIFEAQTALDASGIDDIGAALDFTTTAGSQTTGRSGMELTTKSSDNVIVVEHPNYVDNDVSLTNARLWVTFDVGAYIADKPPT